VDIWKDGNIVLFLVLFIPGFISVKVYDLLIPSARRDFSKSLYEVFGFSFLNFAALSWLIIPIHTGNFFDSHKIVYSILIFIIFLVAPTLWPILYIKLSSWGPIAKHVRNPFEKPWDYVFAKRESYWVIVNLRNGQKVGGRFGEKSFASSYPAKEQIYLEEVWELDEKGKFLNPIKRSRGTIILSDKDILSLEFFK